MPGADQLSPVEHVKAFLAARDQAVGDIMAAAGCSKEALAAIAPESKAVAQMVCEMVEKSARQGFERGSQWAREQEAK